MLLRLQRLGLARAFGRDRSNVWLVIGTAAWLLRTANRLRTPTPEIVYRSKLEPGEQLVIDHRALDQRGKAVRAPRRRR